MQGSRSTGKYGQGAASIFASRFGVKGGSTTSRWPRPTTAVVPSCPSTTPSLPNERVIRSKWCGSDRSTRTSPPVMAPSARKVTTS